MSEVALLLRRLAGEFPGSALPAALVISSGIAAQRRSPRATGLELLENAAVTATGLPSAQPTAPARIVLRQKLIGDCRSLAPRPAPDAPASRP